MRKMVKRIHPVYRVEFDGKNCLYVSCNSGFSYCYSEFIVVGSSVRVRVFDYGLNIYGIDVKLKRRIKGFLGKGYSVYCIGVYRFNK